MLNTNREFYVIFQNRAGDKIKPQMRESPAQIGRVGMSVAANYSSCMSVLTYSTNKSWHFSENSRTPPPPPPQAIVLKWQDKKRIKLLNKKECGR